MSAELRVTETIKAELNSLLPTPPPASETDSLRWKWHEVNSSQVCQLAKNYLCLHAMGAPAESVFSTCGNIVICHIVGQQWSQI